EWLASRRVLSLRSRHPVPGVITLFVTTQRRPRLFRDEGVGSGIRGDAAAPVRHALSRGRNDPPRHGDRGAPFCHRPAAPDRRARRGTRIHLLACRRVARHWLGDRAALPGRTTAKYPVNAALWTGLPEAAEGRQLQCRCPGSTPRLRPSMFISRPSRVASRGRRPRRAIPESWIG